MIQILIIEDEPIIAKDIVYAVEDLGYTVSAVCSDHKTALNALEKRVPDLVLCDIMLEGDDWDGVRLAKEIRKLYSVPLIFLTALTDAATISRAAAAEPDAYLTKPFEVRNLYVAIELAISKFALRQEALARVMENAVGNTVGNLIEEKVENVDNQPIMPSEFLPFIAGSFFIKDKKRLVKVRAEDIFWIKADGVYSQLATANRTFMLTTHLGALEEKLKNLSFLRVHRSYLINFQHIDAIEEDVLTIGTERIPLGKSYREAFYRQLQQL